MGRTLLLLAGAAAIVTALAIAHGAGTSVLRTSEDVAAHGDRVLVREIALSGHNTSVAVVRADFADGGSYDGPARLSGQYQGGIYSSDVETDADTLTVVTRASIDRATYVVRSRFVATGGEGPVPVPPPFMASAIFADNTLEMTQPMTITTLVRGMNVNLHSNGHMRFLAGSNPSSVQGFGTHRLHFVSNAGQAADQIFRPPNNPDDLPVTTQVPRVHWPGFNARDFEHLATGTLPGSISGTIQLGTKTDPAILYVDGNLRTTGPVSFEGYGLIIINGNTDFYHDIAAQAGNDTRLAIYGGNHVRFRAGGLNITGHLLAGGNMSFEGDAVINGGITAGNLVTFGAPVTINYRPASCAVTDPLYPGECYEENPDGAEGSGMAVGNSLTLIDHREGG